MTDNNIDYTKRKRRHRIAFESCESRERSACPKCGSILVKRRNRTHDYICPICKWEGEAVRRVIW